MSALHLELRRGESQLWVDSNDMLIRKIEVLSLEVSCTDSSGQELILSEQKILDQKSGRSKTRPNVRSVSEKLMRGEAIVAGIARAMREETGILCAYTWEIQDHSQEFHQSTSFPGLPTLAMITHAKVILEDSQFLPDGYVCEDNGCTTFFQWGKPE